MHMANGETWDKTNLIINWLVRYWIAKRIYIKIVLLNVNQNVKSDLKKERIYKRTYKTHTEFNSSSCQTFRSMQNAHCYEMTQFDEPTADRSKTNRKRREFEEKTNEPTKAWDLIQARGLLRERVYWTEYKTKKNIWKTSSTSERVLVGWKF